MVLRQDLVAAPTETFTGQRLIGIGLTFNFSIPCPGSWEREEGVN